MSVVQARGLQSTDAIGVFDSGLGGLTVAGAIMERLPQERLVYLGDTARVPYGTRSAATVVRYARSCGRLLVRHGVKVIVVACNTVSAVALPALSVELDIPVVGVIHPGAAAGVAASRNGRIGVIATQGTIDSGAYIRATAGLSSRSEVFARAAPLLVPLVEEGWLSGDVPRLAAARYLSAFAKDNIDALVLGCTHYPLLKELLQEVASEVIGPKVNVVDGAAATADVLAELLSDRELANVDEMKPREQLTLMVTDLPKRFAEVGGRFLGRSLDNVTVEQVDL